MGFWAITMHERQGDRIVSRSVGLAHIIRREDGTSEGVWGPHTLKSAFQPIFEFVEERLSISAFEGLIRPFRGGQAISPQQFFLSVAAADRFHVETLTRTLHLLNAGACLDSKAFVFINFDPSLFCDRELVEAALRDMRLVLHEARIEPARVVCEVTEQKTGSQGALTDFVAALRAHGFAIAIDDYGAADSDMERVAALKPDIVKFDAKWITRLMDTRPGQALLSVMVEQFAARGITTVFEGIEEGWQLEMAQEAGAAMVQGYALARPEIVPTSFALFSAPTGHGEHAPENPIPVSESGESLRPHRHRPAPRFGRRTGA
jgi:EAL domain-containing protein (putative c-di-GMP-specific phosphodiesterase class I)